MCNYPDRYADGPHEDPEHDDRQSADLVAREIGPIIREIADRSNDDDRTIIVRTDRSSGLGLPMNLAVSAEWETGSDESWIGWTIRVRSTPDHDLRVKIRMSAENGSEWVEYGITGKTLAASGVSVRALVMDAIRFGPAVSANRLLPMLPDLRADVLHVSEVLR